MPPPQALECPTREGEKGGVNVARPERHFIRSELRIRIRTWRAMLQSAPPAACGAEYKKNGDTTTQDDTVQNQYLSLPYPAVTIEELIKENKYYSSGTWDT